MLSFDRISHDPTECKDALSGSAGPIYIDTETTGVFWSNRIVSVGLLVDDVIYILFVRSHHPTVRPHQITVEQLRNAMRPLSVRRDITAVFHTAPFDLVKLRKDGIKLRCKIEDTFKLLKLIDPDRGWEPEDEEQTGRSTATICRWERRFEEHLNYRLKDVVRHLIGLNAPSLPGAADSLDYDRHVEYLASDVLITRELHRYLRAQLNEQEASYYDELVAPLTPILADMTFTGFRADSQFIVNEQQRLRQLMQDISAAHQQRFGMRLNVRKHVLSHWIFQQLGCQPRWEHKRVKTASGAYVWSLNRDELQKLLDDTDTPATEQSIRWIMDYELAKTLSNRLPRLRKTKGKDKAVQNDGRCHSYFDDRQASGRISSKEPNIQGLTGLVAKGKQKEFISDGFQDVVVRSRNALIASPGFRLVAFDIAQADVRCLAHCVESFQQTASEHLDELRSRYESPSAWQSSLDQWDFFQTWNCRPQDQTSPQFDPQLPCRLAVDFRQAKTDFYTVASTRMLGKPPANKTERDRMKRTILGIVNGMSVETLGERLGVSKSTAQDYMKRFAKAYPQVAAFTNLMQHAFAISGTAVTSAGRPRRITPHWWMVTQPYVDLFVSYSTGAEDKLWVRVVPLRASRFVLTCRVLRVIDVKYGSLREGQEIYNDQQGRISTAYYRFFEDHDLVFRLPIRNIPWKIIGRVRTRREEVQYEGCDRVRRQLFNHLCQGGTADVAKRMMIRSVPVCRTFGARLLHQIHDELVYEVPINRTARFIRRMREVLERPPTPGFRVPIVVEPKAGRRFGQLTPVPPRQTRLPPRNLGTIVRRCVANGQYRHLRRLIFRRLAGRRLTRFRFTRRGSVATQSRAITRRILSTYQ